MPAPVARSRALYLGFAGLLLLMAGIAFDSGRSFLQVEDANSRVRMESRHREALLNQLRLDTYRAATVVRDHLVETDDDLAASHKAELGTLRARVTDTIALYAATLPPAEREPFRKLQDDVAAYCAGMPAPAVFRDPTT
jgi:hypothetical protein